MVGKVDNKDQSSETQGALIPSKGEADKAPVQARRKLVFGGTAVLATLASSSVLGDGRLGYICSPSGFMSGNMSGNHDLAFRCGGFSPGGWRENARKGGNQDGSVHDWVAAGCYPYPRDHTIDIVVNDRGDKTTLEINFYEHHGVDLPTSGVPSTFYAKFGVLPGNGDSATTLLQVMEDSNSVERHFVAGYLNANLFANGNPKNFAFYISPALVVDMYREYALSGYDYYQTSGGNKLYAGDLKDFFNRTYH